MCGKSAPEASEPNGLMVPGGGFEPPTRGFSSPHYDSVINSLPDKVLSTRSGGSTAYGTFVKPENDELKAEKKKAGAAGTAAGHGKTCNLENVTSPADENKQKLFNDVIRAFNALGEVEQRALAVAVAPAVFGDEAWPMYALWARQVYGAPLPLTPPPSAAEIEIFERKWLMIRIWNTLSADDRLAFLRKVVSGDELRQALL